MNRRAVSSFVFLSMLNVMALSGLTLARHASRDDGPQEMAGMPGMDMSGHSSHSPHGSREQPCRLPWSPGCASLSPCSAIALVAEPTPLLMPAVAHGSPSLAVFLVPASAD